MKTYSAEYLHWLRHHVPRTREDYLEITRHAGPFPPAFPRTIYLEIGAECNLNCTFCSKASRRKFLREMDMATLCRVVEECATQGVYALYTHDFNEPLLHTEKLLPVIRHAKALGIPIVAVTTNITPLSERVMAALIDVGLDTLHLSFEGADPALYEEERGVRYQVIAARIRSAAAVRRRSNKRNARGQLMPWLAITMVRTTETEEQCARFLTQWQEIVDDIEIRPALEYLDRTQFKGALVPKYRVPCRYMGDRLIITADGTVTACSVDVDAELALGNVMDGDTLTRIWQSERYRNLWALHQWERWGELPEPCKSCKSYDFTATARSQHLQQTVR